MDYRGGGSDINGLLAWDPVQFLGILCRLTGGISLESWRLGGSTIHGLDHLFIYGAPGGRFD
jgi:hypothetical protein